MKLFRKKRVRVKRKRYKEGGSDRPHLYNLLMPYELYESAKKKALSERRSLAEVVRELLREWLNE